jgi:hypothetical protein
LSTLAHGCSKSCDCCGGDRCEQIDIHTPDAVVHDALEYDTVENDIVEAVAQMPLVLFFHGYSADSAWATERYFLDHLVANNSYVVIGLNGRQVSFFLRECTHNFKYSPWENRFYAHAN